MQPNLTRTQQFAEVVLGRPLSEYVGEKRQARPRWSWALIAEQLAIDTDAKIAITGQALWAMYADSERAAS